MCSAVQTCTVTKQEYEDLLEGNEGVASTTSDAAACPNVEDVQSEDFTVKAFEKCALACKEGYVGTAKLKCTGFCAIPVEGKHKIENSCVKQTCSLLKSDIEAKLHFDFNEPPCSDHQQDGDKIVLYANATNGATSCDFQCAERYYRSDGDTTIPFTCAPSVPSSDQAPPATGESNIDPSNAAAHQCKGVCDSCSDVVCRIVYMISGVGVTPTHEC